MSTGNLSKPLAYIAFQGGGALGMAHLGAWQRVSQDFEIIGTSGTSAGAIVASFCAAGYTPEHSKSTFSQLDWLKCVKRQNVLKLLWKKDAYSDGEYFHEWLQEKLGEYFSEKRSDVTFAQLDESKKIYLAIVACDLNSESEVIFDKRREPITTVSFAVRSSISIPGLFKPMSRRDRKQELVDGGLLLNFPVELLYDQAKEKNCALIGVRFKEEKEYLKSPKVSKTIQKAIKMMTRRGSLPSENIAQYHNYIDIEIDVSGFDFLEFNLTDKQKEELVKKGEEAAKLALLEYKVRTSNQSGFIPPGGSFTEGSFKYVKRTNEDDWYKEILIPGNLIRIKAPLQMGKTLLMSKILEYAKEYRYRTMLLNLRDAGEEDFTSLDKFLRWFCINAATKLGLTQSVDEHWQDSPNLHKIKCRTYLEKYLLPGDTPLVIAIDEVDRLFHYRMIAGDFLGMLRTWHEDAKTREIWKQLRLLVLHTKVYTQVDINKSPFNAGTEIKLTDLSDKQVQDLASQYGLDWDDNQVRQLMEMVGGHPYLVSKAFKELVNKQDMTLEQLLQLATEPTGIYWDHLRKHLRNLEQYPQLYAAFQELLTRGTSLELNSEFNLEIAVKLKELGLVKLQNDSVMPRYQLYTQYFRSV